MTVAGGARFEGKVLFATGGASGLARAVAQRFTAEGGRVAVADLDMGRAQATAAELDGAVALELDVSDEAAVKIAVNAAREQLGSIDCLFNAAGHAEFAPIGDWTFAQWQRMMTVHAGGTFLVCREIVPVMRAQGAGSIVNVASVAALVAQANNVPYGAAKGAITAFSRQAGPRGRAGHPSEHRRAGPSSHWDDRANHDRAGGQHREGSAAFGHGNLQRARPSRTRLRLRCASCSLTTPASSRAYF